MYRQPVRAFNYLARFHLSQRDAHFEVLERGRSAGVDAQRVETRVSGGNFRFDIVNELRHRAHLHLSNAAQGLLIVQPGHFADDRGSQSWRGFDPQGIEPHEGIEILAVQQDF